MASLAEIQALVEQIKNDLPALINRSKIAPKQITIVNGLSDMSERLGLLQAGEFRSGNGQEPGFGFSGVRLGYPAFAYAGDTWNFAGVNVDVLQVGISADDGRLYFGAGSGIMNSSGIEIVATGVLINSNGYKFTDAPDGNILGGLYNFFASGTSYVELRSQPEAGSGISNTIASIESVASSDAIARMTADSGGYGGNASMLLLLQSATERLLYITDVLTVDFSSANELNFQATLTQLGNTEMYGDLVLTSGKNIIIDDDLPLMHQWFPQPSHTWTRVTDHSFTVDGDVADIYRKGTKVAYTEDGNNGYGVVLSSSYDGVGDETTVELIPNTDYTLSAGTTLADFQVSYSDNPVGFPGYFNWDSSPTNYTLGDGTLVARFFATANGWIDYEWSFDLGTTGAVTGQINITPPAPAAHAGIRAVVGVVAYLEAGVVNWGGVALALTGVSSDFGLRAFDGNTATYVRQVNIGATVPFTFGAGDGIYITGRYRY
jgi:hypothetical protein